MNEYGILNILMVFFSALIVSVYLKAFHNDKKSRTTVCASAWGLYIIFQCWVMASHASHPLLVLIVNILLIFLIYEVSYQVDFKTALFRAGFFYVLWMLVEIATNYMLGKLGNTTVPSSFLVGSIISKLIMYIAVHIFKRLHKKDFSTGISQKYWIRLCFVPVVTIYIIHFNIKVYQVVAYTLSDIGNKRRAVKKDGTAYLNVLFFRYYVKHFFYGGGHRHIIIAYGYINHLCISLHSANQHFRHIHPVHTDSSAEQAH